MPLIPCTATWIFWWNSRRSLRAITRRPSSALRRLWRDFSGGQQISSSHRPSGIHIFANRLRTARHSSMRLEARKYLFDIQEGAGFVSQFTAGKALADYQRDPMLRLAVERAFTIIGEALTQLSR